VARTTAAFGPLAEAAWSPEFRPDFVFPQPAAGVAGAVFRTPDGKIWLLHDFDTAAGFVQYVIAGTSELVTLSIHATADASGTAVTMTYDITALDERGAMHLAKSASQCRCDERRHAGRDRRVPRKRPAPDGRLAKRAPNSSRSRESSVPLMPSVSTSPTGPGSS
jgi:hypothetical protein